jgi:hypothetical protein
VPHEESSPGAFNHSLSACCRIANVCLEGVLKVIMSTFPGYHLLRRAIFEAKRPTMRSENCLGLLQELRLRCARSEVRHLWPWAGHALPMAIRQRIAPPQRQGFASPGSRRLPALEPVPGHTSPRLSVGHRSSEFARHTTIDASWLRHNSAQRIDWPQ